MYKKLALLIVFISSALVVKGQTYTFTTAGATGINGPTQAQVNAAYASTSLNGLVTVVNGIQNWEVPVAGTYKIEVTGANGYGLYGGKGAYMSGEFFFNQGDQLKILVGQQGGCCVGSGTNQYGGGGGTFVVTSTNTPLIIAGGGGGAGSFYNNVNYATGPVAAADANITTNGNSGTGTTIGAGGTNGNGGNEGSGGAGGGGFLTDANTQYGGKSFLNGGTGGTTTGSGGWGGFGGGGGCNSWNNMRGGGGGGYSGGGGAGSSTTVAQIGGGGGSYNNGMNQLNLPGVGTGDGLVVITLLTPVASVPNNMGAVSFPSLTGGGFCSGVQPVTVRVRNFGNNPIDSVKVGWTVNGVLQSEAWYQVGLDTFPTIPYDTVLSLGTYNFGSGSYVVRAWTSLPNNNVDTVNGNDTATLTVTTMMSGTYTINSAQPTAGTNYQSFTAFANDLNTIGVCGPVVANVVAGSGPYTETVSFGNITGASAVNTIRINGNGETIQFNPTSTANQNIVTLNGTKYMTVNNLKIKSLSASYGWGVFITGDAARDSIINCEIDLTASTNTSSTNANGIVVSGSSTSATTASDVTHLFIGYNNVKAGGTGSGGAYYGITFSGVSSTAPNDSIFIVGNEVTNFYYYGIRCSYAKGGEVSYNNIHRTTQTSIGTTAYGIYYYYGVGVKCIGNKIHDMAATGIQSTSTFYGLYNYHYNNTAATPILIANNILYNLGNYSGSQYLMYNYGPAQLVYHNTIDLSALQSTSTSTIYAMYNGYNNGSEYKNNIINITGGNNGTKYGMYHSSTTYAATYQKNNVYINSSQPGTQTPYYYSTSYASLAAFQAAYPAQEVGSTSLPPQFVSPTTGNLTPDNLALLGTGENLTSLVPTDINNIPRPATPTIGAFEPMPTNNNDATVMSILSPTGNLCAATVPVEVIIRNAGINNITSLQVNWSLNGVTQTPFNYTGTMVPATATSGQNMDTVVIGNAPLVAGLNTIVVWTSQPNGQADPNTANDTLSTSITTTSFNIASAMDTLCANSIAAISLTPNSGYAPGAIQWQYSTNGGTTWTTIPNSDYTTHIVNGLTAETQFRAAINTGGANLCYTNTWTMHFIDPAVLSTVPAERCGPGTLTLQATTIPGNELKWYADATTSTSLATGSSFTTPNLSATTTYYVAAATSGGSAAPNTLATINSGGNGCGGGVMFDLNPINNITIDSFSARGNVAASNVTVNIYTKAGTFQGFETNTAAWTLYESVVVPTTASGVLFTIPLTIPMTLTASQLTGVYIEYDASYTNTTTPTTYANSDLQIIVGTGLCSPFGGTNAGRAFNGAVHYRTAAGCESPRVPVVATINNAPTLDIGSDQYICPGETATLNANASGTGLTYLWSNNATTPSITVNTAGTYTVAVSNGLCESYDTVQVLDAPVPTPALTPNVAICDGDAATLNAGNPGATYLWSDNSTGQSLTVDQAGTYTVTITNNYNCSIEDSAVVVVNPLPVVELGNDTMVCENTALTFDAANPGATYLWSTGDTTQQITVNQGGTYSVTVTNEYNCSASDDVEVIEYPPVSIDGFTFVPKFEIQVGRVDFFPLNPQLVNEYLWDFGDGSTSTQATPIHIYAASGNYLVSLTVSNECSVRDTSLLIYVDLLTGVKFVDADEVNVNIYPVPTQHSLNVELAETNNNIRKIRVVNTIGQTLIEQGGSNTQKQSVDVSNLSAGNYFIYIETDHGNTVRKFNKQD